MILNLKNVDINEWGFLYDVEKYNESNIVGYYIYVIKNDHPCKK